MLMKLSHIPLTSILRSKTGEISFERFSSEFYMSGYEDVTVEVFTQFLLLP